MHYLPIFMHSNNAEDSIKSPFYYAFDGKRVAVCFCVDKDFVNEQLEISRKQHFTEEYIEKSDGYWGLGMMEFGTIDQVVAFVKRWNVLVDTRIGKIAPSSLALWRGDEPHRFITFEDIEKQVKLASQEVVQ